MEKVLKRLKEQQSGLEEQITEIEQGMKVEDKLRRGLESNRRARKLSKRQFAIKILGISPQNYNNVIHGVQGYKVLERLHKRAIDKKIK